MYRSPRVDAPTTTMSAEPSRMLTKIAAADDRAASAEATLHRILETSQEASLIQRNSVVQYVNPALRALLGYEPGDLIGENSVTAIVHPDDHAALVDAQRRSEAGEEALPLRTRWLRKNGAIVWIEGARTIIDYLGAPAVIVRARDITQEIDLAIHHEETELSLRITDERYRVLFEQTPLAIWIFDPVTLSILTVNAAALALYGYTREEFASKRISDLRVYEEHSELMRDVADASSFTDSAWRATRAHRKKDGTIFRIEITAHTITLAGKTAMLCIGRDVTELERMEQQLRQSQKMDAIGQLAGGIAHDFNNILAVILAVTDMMLLDVDDQHPFVEDLREIESAARRASALTHQLLAFSRQQPARPKNIPLKSVIEHMEKMLARTVRENITMTLDLASNGIIYADPSHVEQVLLNLVVNARDAMPDGGTLLIQTEDIHLNESCAVVMGVKPGAYQQLSVSDTGCGMPPSIQARIFDPFFTTKEIGKGTGLGLATVFGIVKQGCGGITVDSAVGRGSAFKIVFPQVNGSADSIPARAESRAQGSGSETVLLVEDDENVRRVVSRVLRSNGYIVIEANDGEAALAVVASGKPIDLLVSDLMMPNMDGRALGRQIALRFPGMKMLFMSGHDLTGPNASDTPIAAESFISKPFTPADMLTAIRGVLGN